MINKLIAIFSFSFLFYSCSNNLKDEKADKIKQIEALRSSFYDEMGKTGPDMEKARQLVADYQSFYASYPKDEKTPGYLYDAASITGNILKDPEKSIDLYQMVVAQYPNSEKAPVSLFTQAFIYENVLMDLKKADEKYHAFLEAYPNHELSGDARESIKNLGKSPEELLNEVLSKKTSDSIVK